MFKELTRKDGQTVWLNIAQVIAVFKTNDGLCTRVVFIGDEDSYYDVKESVEELFEVE